jgi:hypothetical protein
MLLRFVFHLYLKRRTQKRLDIVLLKMPQASIRRAIAAFRMARY